MHTIPVIYLTIGNILGVVQLSTLTEFTIGAANAHGKWR